MEKKISILPDFYSRPHLLFFKTKLKTTNKKITPIKTKL